VKTSILCSSWFKFDRFHMAFPFTVAAIVAIVFAAATPAKAASILIDNFTTGIGTVSQNNSIAFSPRTGYSGGFPASIAGVSVTATTDPVGSTNTLSISGGVATLTSSRTGSPSNIAVPVGGLFGLVRYQNGPVDLTSGGSNNFIEVTVGSTVPTLPGVDRYFRAQDSDTIVELFLGPWVANEVYYIPFSSFPGIDFTAITQLDVGFENTVEISPSTSFTETLTLTSVSSVPEPSTVALAGIGALALGAGAIRRSRKARKAAAEGTLAEAV